MSTSQICDYCGDPAVLFREIKHHFWPFAVLQKHSYCYECYQELVNKRLPKLTDSRLHSRRGSGIQKRRRLQS